MIVVKAARTTFSTLYPEVLDLLALFGGGPLMSARCRREPASSEVSGQSERGFRDGYTR
jgi:hypothetical protein